MGCRRQRAPDSKRARTESLRQKTSRFHPFTSKRFHVLLNSLFKVLFNFPSRYFFAIGLSGIFSLRWSIPPTLGCTFKQPDSRETAIPKGKATIRDSHPLRSVPHSWGLRPPSTFENTASHTPHFPVPREYGIRRWAGPFSLAATGGIPFGFFSST